MRLKRLFAILLLPCLATAMAAAAETQLSQVEVSGAGSASTITLRANGPFTHTEYRPTDNLLLVDLAGVSAARMDGKTHQLHAPGLVSYRVLGYKSSDGADVARVELTLAAGSEVKFSEGSDQLAVSVSPLAGAAAGPVAAAIPAKATPSGRPVRIEHVGVAEVHGAPALEIVASGPITSNPVKLTSPDRLVLDIPNATLAARPHTLAVNGDTIKDVRSGRFQMKPPVTRVVVDLAKDSGYQLASKGNRLTVEFRGPASAETAAPTSATPAPAVAAANVPAPAVVLPPMAASTEPAKTDAAPVAAKATDFAVIQPEMHHVTAEAKASDAASRFSSNDTSFNMGTPESAALRPASAVPTLQFQQAASSAASTATRPKYTGEPISVNLKDVDLKDFFRLIHEISGLNVVLDPEVHGTLTLVLDDVPWDQALDIVLKNNGLDRQLEGNVLRIATVETLKKEADARREQIEAQALAVDKVTVTRFLSYAHAKDVVPTVKKFLSSRGDVVSDDRTNALIIDDIPNVIPKIDDLLVKLDRKTPQVEIEARVIAATRSFSREIGTQLGLGWGINSNDTLGGNGAAGASNTGITFPVPTGAPAGATGVNYPTVKAANGNAVPLFSNLGLTQPTSGMTFINATRDFRLDFQLSLAESRGLLKILARPRVVTQNNIQAVVKQGVRVPIVTQAQLGGPPTVTYVDAELRLTVTPQITSENTIFLNIDVESTTPDFTQVVQGNPTLDTAQATTQVLVTDGGTVVIGGVIQTKNQVHVDQVPLLGNIPLLGNLFKHNLVSTQTQELIFFITPRIIQS